MTNAVKLTLPEATLTGMTLAYHAQERPAKMAVISNYGNRTFAELNARANQLARVLRNAGLKPDDGVAMLLVNRPEFLEVYYACMRAGFRVTPINWHLTGDNASYIVGNCEAKAFIADIRCAQPAIDALQDNHSQLKLALSVGGDLPGFQAYNELVDSAAAGNIDAPEIGGQMLYTSGTTGRPKGVYRQRTAAALPGGAVSEGENASQASRAAAETTAISMAAAAYDAETDRALCTGPAYHAAPLAFNIIAPLAAGVGTVLMDKWDPEETLRLVEEYDITHTHMVATMFHRLLALPAATRDKYQVDKLRFVLHGAAPCPVHVKQSMMAWLGPVVYEYYAATEGGGGFFIGPQEWLTKPGSVGKAPPSADNKICDDDGKEVATGTVGTIYFRAPEIRFEYYKDTAKTAGSYQGDYFTLGDMGYFDADGYLFLTGRSAETIISGGVNIYPQETDDVLLRHPAVADVCTIGIPSEEWGEDVKSVVMLKPGIAPDQGTVAELIAFVREHLPAFKAPRTIDFTEDLPRLPSGKIQRRLVREPYWAGRDRQI
ncbi:MAG: AMP-binding protein [SAR86 cluster bacterium]|jgi:long-chain acyl-CoA synthetase|tara:strand:+ start:4963 stop:6600 length:1638 start_codon:yes stop_codon:yes gene_type:complete